MPTFSTAFTTARAWGIGAKVYTNEELGAAIVAAAPIAAAR